MILSLNSVNMPRYIVMKTDCVIKFIIVQTGNEDCFVVTPEVHKKMTLIDGLIKRLRYLLCLYTL